MHPFFFRSSTILLATVALFCLVQGIWLVACGGLCRRPNDADVGASHAVGWSKSYASFRRPNLSTKLRWCWPTAHEWDRGVPGTNPTQPYAPRLGVLPGASGRRALDGLKRSFAKIVWKTSLGYRAKAWKGYVSPPTQQLLPFPFRVQPTDARLRRLAPYDKGTSPRPRAWRRNVAFGSCIASDSLPNSGPDFCSFAELVVFFVAHDAGNAQSTRTDMNNHASGSRSFISFRGGL